MCNQKTVEVSINNQSLELETKETTSYKKEDILVVPRSNLDLDNMEFGLFEVDEVNLFNTIISKAQFLNRNLAENDACFKQIIPYMVYRHGDKYFLMQRSGKAGEQRLANKFSLGIGGHIQAKDLLETKSIIEWGKREFLEEVNFRGNFESKFLGIINDELSEVGKVHLGIVFILEGNSDDISVREELVGGELLTLSEILEKQVEIEAWSKIVIDYLINSY